LVTTQHCKFCPTFSTKTSGTESPAGLIRYKKSVSWPPPTLSGRARRSFSEAWERSAGVFFNIAEYLLFYTFIIAKLRIYSISIDLQRIIMATNNSEKIGVATATIIGMNAMIGAGIFSMTCSLASGVGPASILSYLCAFFAVWFIAQSIARAANLWPQEGGFYTYTRQWAGHTMGLIAAGSYLFGFLIAMALLCKVAGECLHNVFPAVSDYNLGLIVLGSLLLLNLMGLALSQIGQYILIVCTVFSLVATTLLCLTKINLVNLIPFMPHGPMSILLGTRVAIFGLFGFECVTSLCSIVQDPEKNVPKALRYSLLIVGLIYLFFIGSILLSIPLSLFTANDKITISQALQIVFPENKYILYLIEFSILSAIIGTIHSMIWAGSQLMLSFSKIIKAPWMQRLVAKGLVSQKTTVLLCGLIMYICFTTIDNKDLFFTLTNIGLIFPFITTMIALLFQRSEWKSGQNYTTIFGLVTALFIFGIAVQKVIENLQFIF